MKDFNYLWFPFVLLITFSAQGQTKLPQDVQLFIDEVDLCQHQAGEWDSSLPLQDKASIEEQVQQHCSQATKLQKSLRNKYRDNHEIMAIIY